MNQRKDSCQDLCQLSDTALLEQFERVVACHHRSAANLLAHLAEVDARRLYAQRSHSSMFGYCTSELGMTRDEAYNRITAARAMRDYPELQDYVARGKLHLTAIKRLQPHLTRDNASSLFEAASGKTKERVELMLAERFPKPDVATSLRKLPSASPIRQAPPVPAAAGAAASSPPAVPSAASSPPPAASSQRSAKEKPKLEALSPKRYKLQLTVSQTVVDKLKTAQHLLKHELPAGDIDVVLERALDELVDKLQKRKFAAGSTKPRTPISSTLESKTQRKRAAKKRSRHVSAADKREVLERDGMQCTFVDVRGRRCEEKGGLEFAHIEADALGGAAVASNLRLRCRAHNRLDADRDFGRAKMNRVIDKVRQRWKQRAPQRSSQLVEQPQPQAPAQVADCRQVEMFQPAKQQASTLQDATTARGHT